MIPSCHGPPQAVAGLHRLPPGFARAHIVATTPARSRAAHRNSPSVTGLSVRSLDHIYFSGGEKGAMSGKSDMAIKLRDLLTNPKGGKFFPVSAEDGGPAVWQCDWIRILWHPAAYNGEDARRLPLCLEPNQAPATELAGFEKALVAQLAARSQADSKILGACSPRRTRRAASCPASRPPPEATASSS